jgi:DNA-binding CsgD family transcriptional regulator
MQEGARNTERDGFISKDSLMLTYVLATLGFGCMMGWELIGVFSPTTTLLSYYSITEAIALRIVSLVALLATYIFCATQADWVYQHRTRLIFWASILSIGVVANAAISHIFGTTPIAVAVVSWMLFGVAECILAMAWCTFYSLIPSEGTAVSIALGACIGTAFFVLVAASSPAIVGLLEIAFLLLASLMLVLFLLSKIPKERVLPVEKYRDSPVFNSPALFSVAAFGIVYGFISIFMCFIGPHAAIIGGAGGIVGTLVALIWARLGNKVDINNGTTQRISLPIIVCGLLLLPFFGETGQILCGACVITALSHATVVALYSSCIESSEFQLHPIKRFSHRRIPNWVGFLIGVIIALVILPVLQLSGTSFSLAMVALVVIAILAFVIYGADDSRTKTLLDEFLVLREEPLEKPEDTPHLPLFRQRCELVIETHKLSPREAEVFFLLAKGRNAEYIQKELLISSATVKTHIYHIYQKLNINSQQRLMDVVDAADTHKKQR